MFDTVELATACAAGIKDVLLAYSVVGANAARVREWRGENRDVRFRYWSKISRRLRLWKGSRVGFSST